MLLLQSMLCISLQKKNDAAAYNMRDELTRYVVTYVPLMAEAELFAARHGQITAEMDRDVFDSRTGWELHGLPVPRRSLFLKRYIRHGRFILTNAPLSDFQEFMKEAWPTRYDRKDLAVKLLKQSAEILDIVQHTAMAPLCSPEAMWRAARALMWEWAALVDMDFTLSRRGEVDALEGLINWQAINCSAGGDAT